MSALASPRVNGLLPSDRFYRRESSLSRDSGTSETLAPKPSPGSRTIRRDFGSTDRERPVLEGDRSKMSGESGTSDVSFFDHGLTPRRGLGRWPGDSPPGGVPRMKHPTRPSYLQSLANDAEDAQVGGPGESTHGRNGNPTLHPGGSIMKRTLFFCLAFVAVAALLGGCGGGGSSSNTGTVTVSGASS